MVVFINIYDVKVFGEFSFINAFVIILFLISSLGLRNVGVVESENISISLLFFTRITLSSFTVFLLFILFLFIEVDVLFCFVLVAMRYLESISEIFWIKRHVKGEYFKIFVFQAGRWLLAAFCFVFSALLGCDVYIALFMYLLGALIVFIIDAFLFKVKTQIKIYRLKKVLELVIKFYTLSISLGMQSLQQNLPRLLLGVFIGSKAVGIFSVAYQFYNMSFMIFQNSKNFILKSGNMALYNLRREILFSLSIAILLFSGWYILGDLFLKLLLPELDSSTWIITLYLYFALNFKFIGYCFQHQAMQFGEYTSLFKINLYTAFLSVVFAVPLIYYFKLEGAIAYIIVSNLIYLVVAIQKTKVIKK